MSQEATSIAPPNQWRELFAASLIYITPALHFYSVVLITLVFLEVIR